MRPGALPRHSARGKLTIVRPGDAAQQQQLCRALAAQEDLFRTSTAAKQAPAPCTCMWDGVAPEAAVDAPAGRLLANIGRYANGRKILVLEELLFLSEAHALTVLAAPAPDAPPEPLDPAAVFCAVLQAGLAPAVYTVYAHLKRLGYALRRHFDRPRPAAPAAPPVVPCAPAHHAAAAAPPPPPPSGAVVSKDDDSKKSVDSSNGDDGNRDGPSRPWWPCTFGPVPAALSTFRWRVDAAPLLDVLHVPAEPRAGETFTRVVERCAELLVCYDVVRPCRRPGGPPDMYVVVATALPALDVIHALARCARGRPVRIACCTETGGLAFYAADAYAFFA